MDKINAFIITLVTTLIFMTAIELIGPDNSMKKYLKFVLGLILISVLLNPIVNFFTNGEVIISNLIDEYSNEVSASSNTKENTKDTEGNKSIQEEQFKDNFNKSCVKLLQEKYKDYDFKSKIDCTMNFSTGDFDVKTLMVAVSNKGVKKVEKVQIGDEKPKEDDKTLKEIKSFLAENLKVQEEKIQVYYE